MGGPYTLTLNRAVLLSLFSTLGFLVFLRLLLGKRGPVVKRVWNHLKVASK